MLVSGDGPKAFSISFELKTLFCTALKYTEICCLRKYLEGGTFISSTELVGVIGEGRGNSLTTSS